MNKYFQAPWTIKEIIIAFCVALIGMSAAILVLNYFKIDELITSSSGKTLIILGVFLLQWLILLLPIGFITYRKGELSKKSLGLKNIGAWPTIKMIFGAYLVFLGISFLIVAFMITTGIQIPGYQVQEKILYLFSGDTVSLLFAGFFIVILAPIVEELFFRGVLLRTLVDKIGKIRGSIIVAAIFAVFHMQWQSIIPVFILGLIINSIAIRSRSIMPAIYFHMFNNLVAFGIELMIIKEAIKIDALI
ncbi:CPBP family intramembrane metalloprotease [Candidatus Peregrinibacteria bacterium]|nr:CPBP family intramembrane metalloprotease [Candidatus Peregrinibacteria bacterium]